jgi:hypothetical protein
MSDRRITDEHMRVVSDKALPRTFVGHSTSTTNLRGLNSSVTWHDRQTQVRYMFISDVENRQT